MIEYSFSVVELEYFLLILTRVTFFISVAPFFGMNNTPRRVKIGLGVFTSLLLYHVTAPHEVLVYHTVWGYGVIVMKEALTGLLVGFGAQMCTTVVGFAGRITDMNIGLSMVSMLDPTTRENTSITGIFQQYIIMLMLIVSGMYEYILRALADTFRLIPVNGAVFHVDRLLASVVTFMSDYIIIGFRICLPVFTVIMVLDSVLAILAKVAPQMNMFTVGIQLKLLVGLATMFLTVVIMPGAAGFIFTEIQKMVTAFVEGMM